MTHQIPTLMNFQIVNLVIAIRLEAIAIRLEAIAMHIKLRMAWTPLRMKQMRLTRA